VSVDPGLCTRTLDPENNAGTDAGRGPFCAGSRVSLDQLGLFRTGLSRCDGLDPTPNPVGVRLVAKSTHILDGLRINILVVQ
jgi:hypothetical protein